MNLLLLCENDQRSRESVPWVVVTGYLYFTPLWGERIDQSSSSEWNNRELCSETKLDLREFVEFRYWPSVVAVAVATKARSYAKAIIILQSSGWNYAAPSTCGLTTKITSIIKSCSGGNFSVFWSLRCCWLVICSSNILPGWWFHGSWIRQRWKK